MRSGDAWSASIRRCSPCRRRPRPREAQRQREAPARAIRPCQPICGLVRRRGEGWDGDARCRVRQMRQRHLHTSVSPCPTSQDLGSSIGGASKDSALSGAPACPLRTDRPRSSIRSEAQTCGAPGLATESGAPRAPIPSQPRHGHPQNVRLAGLVWSPHAELASQPSVCRKGRAENAVLSYCQLPVGTVARQRVTVASRPPDSHIAVSPPAATAPPARACKLPHELRRNSLACPSSGHQRG